MMRSRHIQSWVGLCFTVVGLSGWYITPVAANDHVAACPIKWTSARFPLEAGRPSTTPRMPSVIGTVARRCASILPGTSLLKTQRTIDGTTSAIPECTAIQCKYPP